MTELVNVAGATLSCRLRVHSNSFWELPGAATHLVATSLFCGIETMSAWFNLCSRENDHNHTAFGYSHRSRWWRYDYSFQARWWGSMSLKSMYSVWNNVPSKCLQALRRSKGGELGPVATQDRFTSCWCHTHQARTRSHPWFVHVEGCDEFLAQGDRIGAVGSAPRQDFD